MARKAKRPSFMSRSMAVCRSADVEVLLARLTEQLVVVAPGGEGAGRAVRARALVAEASSVEALAMGERVPVAASSPSALAKVSAVSGRSNLRRASSCSLPGAMAR
eukprot:3372713-Prymnesium_polylepis.1